jgi:predicted ArsR family transcriptional regulator
VTDAAISPLTDAKRRLMERLKMVDSATAPELATEFQLTDTAVRQHLDSLEASGLVARAAAPPIGRGRPPVRWHLTPLAAELFPDRHRDLTAELLTAIREEFGEPGLQRVLSARASMQLDHYRESVGDSGTSVRVRARRLADMRTAEGYMADLLPAVEDDPSVVLVEHHCPIRGAAGACGGLCQAELDVFREALGPDVVVERTQHLLAGDRRCAYRISPAVHAEPAEQVAI